MGHITISHVRGDYGSLCVDCDAIRAGVGVTRASVPSRHGHPVTPVVMSTQHRNA